MIKFSGHTYFGDSIMVGELADQLLYLNSESRITGVTFEVDDHGESRITFFLTHQGDPEKSQ